MAGGTDQFVAPVCEEQLEILFKDNFILLVNKPSGLLSLSGKNPLNKDSVHSRSRVIFTPQTGRTHQLRLHSREIGHPILGCDLYGSKRTRAFSSRILLHAASIEFEHPVSAERIAISCDCPF